MKCANCGTDNPPAARYCGECGAPLLQPQPSAASPSPTAWSPPPADAWGTPPPPLSPPPSSTWGPPAWSPAPATDYNELRRISAEQKSFTTQAVITLVLYIVLWFPGLIANIVFYNEAKSIERISGRAPEGKGCLLALLIVFVGLPVLAICGAIAISVLGSTSS